MLCNLSRAILFRKQHMPAQEFKMLQYEKAIRLVAIPWAEEKNTHYHTTRYPYGASKFCFNGPTLYQSKNTNTTYFSVVSTLGTHKTRKSEWFWRSSVLWFSTFMINLLSVKCDILLSISLMFTYLKME